MPNTIKDSSHLSNKPNTHLSNSVYRLSSKPNTKMSNSVYAPATSKDYNLANLVRSALSDPDLSHGASQIFAQIILSAGRKGFVNFLISTLCDLGKIGRSQCKRYLAELQTKQKIAIEYRPGRSSVFYVLEICSPIRKVGRKTGPIKQLFKNKTVTEPTLSNVFCQPVQEEPEVEKTTHHDTNGKICSPDPDEKLPEMAILPKATKTVEPSQQSQAGPVQKRIQPINFSLVREILSLTNDLKSLGFWIKLVKNVEPELVYYMLSALKLAMSTGLVESPGRYLVGIARRVCPWIFEIPSKKQAPRPFQAEKARPLHSKQAQSEPESKPDFDMGLDAIRQIQALLGRKVA